MSMAILQTHPKEGEAYSNLFDIRDMDVAKIATDTLADLYELHRQYEILLQGLQNMPRTGEQISLALDDHMVLQWERRKAIVREMAKRRPSNELEACSKAKVMAADLFSHADNITHAFATLGRSIL